MNMEDSTNTDNTCLDWKQFENVEEKKPLTDEQSNRNTDKTTLQPAEGLFCDPCLFDKTEQEAVGFCKNCAEYLCGRCIKEHKKVKATRGHCIIEENLPEEPELFQTMKQMISCESHPEISVISKCIEHSKFVCSLCIAETHRKCNLHGLTQHREEMCATSVMFEKLDALKLTCETTWMQKESCKTNLLQEQATVKSDIDKFVIDVNERVKELGNAVLNESEEISRGRLSDIESDQKECKDVEDATILHRKLLEASISFRNDSDANVVAKMLSDKLEHGGEKIRNIAAKKIEDVQFKGNSHLLNLQSIGEVKLQSEERESCVASSITQTSDEIHDFKFEPKHNSNGAHIFDGLFI